MNAEILFLGLLMLPILLVFSDISSKDGSFFYLLMTGCFSQMNSVILVAKRLSEMEESEIFLKWRG
jgi:hypothetical protein